MHEQRAIKHTLHVNNPFSRILPYSYPNQHHSKKKRLNTILLVEDDQDDSLLFREILQEIAPSVQCHVVHNGLQALSALNLHPDNYALIVTDINMPIMDGIVFLRKTRELDTCPPVVVLSSVIDRHMLLELGATNAFKKAIYENQRRLQVELILALIPGNIEN